MRYLQGVITWIDSLESGRQFRNWAAILVKIVGVVILAGLSVAGIVACVNTIAASKDAEMIPSILVIIGSLLEVCFVITTAIVLVMLFWNRANKIRTLDNDPNFILISIVVIMVQLLGEVSFIGLIGMGVQTLVASSFGSGLPQLLTSLLHEQQLTGTLPPDLGETPDLIFGVIAFVISVLSGAVLLIVAYFIAEEINVLANIAESLNNIETKLVDEEPASDS